MPRGPIQAKGLLRASILDPNPIIFFEPKSLYRRSEDLVPEDDYMLAIDKADIMKEGKHLTVISYGPQVLLAQEVVNELEQKYEGLSIELIDLQVVHPIDKETIVKSVRKTGRCVITHEAP